MKKFILLILTLFTFFNLEAQFLSIAIELSPDSQLTDLGFSCARVIDDRYNKNNIGQLYRGLGNKKVEVQFINELSEHIQSSLDILIPPSPEKTPLIILIKDLSVSEKIGTQHRYGFCNVEMIIAKQVDSSLYSLGSFNANITGNYGSIKNTHSKRVIESIISCLNQFNNTDWKNNEGKLITEQSDIIFDFNTIPKKGIYLSFNQLANKSPIDSLSFKIHLANKSKQFPAYKLEMDNIFIKEQAQFISDGENLYMRSNQFQFVKARSFGKYIYFQGKVPTKSNSTSHIGTAVVLGGLAGGLVFSVISTNSANTKGKGVVLETETGTLKLVTDLYLYRITKPFPLMLKTYRKSKRKLNDKRDVIIKLNSMFK